jgi:tRNA (guanine-N7-)-methyltransferase
MSMGKNKLRRFEENKTFKHLFQPSAEKMYKTDFDLKGKWHTEYFNNSNPIILEVGCGKGEYTTGLAAENPDRNYIGIDIKGPRLWRGGKTVEEENLTNVAFIRNKVEFLESFFEDSEISEIWITFPDPQPKKEKKRLTSARFLNIYSKILKPQGIVHLKTDSTLIYAFTKEIIACNNTEIIEDSVDVYGSGIRSEVTNIKTHYEKKFLDADKTITYIKFIINKDHRYKNPEEPT